MPEAIIRKRQVYQAAYRNTLEEPVTPVEEPATGGNTSETDPDDTPEERSWKKRYGDLRSYNTKLTDEIKDLKNSVQALQKKDIQIPSTKEEIQIFAQRYPDIFRHIRSIALSEYLAQKQDMVQETEQVKENLNKLTREAAVKKILNAHGDFETINASEAFHEWAQRQSKAIQNMVYESSDPDDCISAIDLYKAQHKPAKPEPKPRTNGADTLVKTRTPTELTEDGGKRVWKASEIGKLTSRQYEHFEEEIEAARRAGRLDPNS